MNLGSSENQRYSDVIPLGRQGCQDVNGRWMHSEEAYEW
jgi:hypothetical protein